MKKLEFETSKGRFLVVDLKNDYSEIYQLTELGYGFLCVLSEITEEQASEVVDCHKSLFGVPLSTHIESLHSFLKSKDIYLFENPVPLLHHSRLEAEEKTFYNPYIFKL